MLQVLDFTDAQELVRLILGPVEIGLLTESILFGTVVIQAYIYYQNFPKDHWSLKSLVCLTFLQLGCMVAGIWTLTTTDNGDLGSRLDGMPIPSMVAAILSAPIALGVQTSQTLSDPQSRTNPPCLLSCFGISSLRIQHGAWYRRFSYGWDPLV
ncbi:hypothetical protein HYDPIDRAFT_111658 [Hydnomerulius pinastri MD-312]|uniref:Uncharacterized protein n=1 Tax=Hydnomerulius pinastri MD-312 TaxID=994086 RepID=A0A0C9WAG7_9AGAM|nr:hypothetical protein HYDPIDRAFT_111658 [Hydnomerulius pinastri MD-312]